MDCVLIQNNKAHEIWRNTSKTSLAGRFTQEIYDTIVDVNDNLTQPGDVWNGASFQHLQAVIHTASGEFKNAAGAPEYGYNLSASGDYSVVVIPRYPDARIEKWGGTAIAVKTQAEIDAYKASKLTAYCNAESRKKDILAMLAVIVRGKDPVAWNGMTQAQKIDAIRAAAGIYKNIREFIDDKI